MEMQSITRDELIEKIKETFDHPTSTILDFRVEGRITFVDTEKEVGIKIITAAPETKLKKKLWLCEQNEPVRAGAIYAAVCLEDANEQAKEDLKGVVFSRVATPTDLIVARARYWTIPSIED